MKRFFIIILLLSVTYLAKPLWEAPVSQYVDLAFLEPVDETIDEILTSDPVVAVVRYVNDTTDQLLTFISTKRNATEKATEDVEKPTLTTPEKSPLSIHNIVLGTDEETVNSILGKPMHQSPNEYDTDWFIYHQDYHNFVMVSFDENRTVAALYTNDNLIASDSGVTYGTAKSVVRETYGEPLEEIRKGLTSYRLQDSEGFDLFEMNEMYVYVFYDLHQNDTVTAVQLVEKSLEQQKNGIYSEGSTALQAGFESQLFELTNAARVKRGLPALSWEENAAETARHHSLDMATQNYFDHENKQGESPFDRMKADGIAFRAAGENLAYGQSSSIFAHEGLMNSLGHRENILLNAYNHLGIGVAFNEKNQPYYTENFLLK